MTARVWLLVSVVVLVAFVVVAATNDSSAPASNAHGLSPTQPTGPLSLPPISSFDNGQGALFANGHWSNGSHGTADAANLSVGVAAQHGRWTTSVSGNYDFKSDTFSSSLSTGRTFDINTKNDLDLQIRGSVDNKGNAFIGAGVTFRF